MFRYESLESFIFLGRPRSLRDTKSDNAALGDIALHTHLSSSLIDTIVVTLSAVFITPPLDFLSYDIPISDGTIVI